MKICEFKQLKWWCLQQKTPIGTRIPCCKKVSRVVSLVPLQGLCFYVCRWNNMTWISRHENGKTIIHVLVFLFIRSGLYSCRNVTFIVSVISKETSWTKKTTTTTTKNKNAVNLYVCILCPALFNTYFSCLAFFPSLKKFTTSFCKWHNTNIYTTHMKLSVY